MKYQRAVIAFVCTCYTAIAFAGGIGGKDPQHAIYVIDNEPIYFDNGEAIPVPAILNAMTSSTTASFEKAPTYGVLNNDGIQNDAAVMIMYNTGGTGNYRCIAAAMNYTSAYRTTNCVPIGDRIRTDQVRIKDGCILVHYRDRRDNQNFGDNPSVKKIKAFRLDKNFNDTVGEQLIEVPSNGCNNHDFPKRTN